MIIRPGLYTEPYYGTYPAQVPDMAHEFGEGGSSGRRERNAPGRARRDERFNKPRGQSRSGFQRAYLS
jgi:hypothetical protein